MDKKLVLVNKLSELDVLVNAVYEFGDQAKIDENIIYDIRLCLDEIFTNIVTHGYRELDSGEIVITLSKKQNVVNIRIEDTAEPVKMDNVPIPDINLPLENRNIGGLGLFLVHQLMQNVEYHSTKEGNVMILKKYL